jgi:predicted nucleic acid-binding protein
LPEVICNTSPLQYLYQLGLLDLLPGLIREIIIPLAVAEELEAGRALGLELPDVSSLDWITVRSPKQSGQEPSFTDLGRGETEVLLLALETSAEVILILDDRSARETAEQHGLKFTGTLGILLDAKHAGLIPAVTPYLDHLDSLGFHLARYTREAVLKLAGE